MAKIDFIFKIIVASFYFIFLILNIRGAFFQNNWIAFAEGVATIICIEEICRNIKELLTYRRK